MFFRKKNIEFEEEIQEPKAPKRSFLQTILDGTLLTREGLVQQLPFIFFLTFLAIIYIANRYHAEKLVREIDVLETELKELRAEAISTSSELMYVFRQSEVEKLMQEKGLDLKESLEPPKKIIVGKK